MVAGELVDEQDRRALATLLYVEADPVVGGGRWHLPLLSVMVPTSDNKIADDARAGAARMQLEVGSAVKRGLLEPARSRVPP
jgi:hypothetical protein